MKILKWVLISIGTLIIIVAVALIKPWVFLPHEKIEISLPFSPDADSYTYLIPMGEKIEHPDGYGHPGIDFGWQKETNVLAVADGSVTSVTRNSENQIIVAQSLGSYYETIYQELNSLEPDIVPSAKLKKGQVIGKTGRDSSMFSGPPPKDGISGQLHWDFKSSSVLLDRLCPVGYFDADSKRRIEAIWARVPSNDQFKKAYPDICSGFYKDRED